MKRAERLYAIVDLLRANSPRPFSAARLAAEFGVSTRTIERDLAGLLQAEVPIYAVAGRTGGYAIDREFSLPPLRFTPREAYAVVTGLAAMAGSPFAPDATTALRKVNAVLGRRDAAELTDTYFLAARTTTDEQVSRTLALALHENRVVELVYDGDRGPTHRTVEPLALLAVRGNWVVAGWCRLRSGIRGFRPDRIREIRLTGETVPDRGEALARDLSRWTFERITGG